MSIVFTISGAFGSGVSSVANLAYKLLDGLDLAVTYTTRPHMEDKEDTEFFFTSRGVFENMIAREEFLEYVSVLDNYYGTPTHYLQQARENGKDLLVQVDDRGRAQIKEKVADTVSILILPGGSARRKRTLGSVADPKLPSFVREVLLPSLLQEVPFPSQMPNTGDYNHVIVSDRVADSARRVISIIRSERLRRS